MNETQAIAKFKRKFPGDLFYKLHGGRYQSSLPDIIWIRDNRAYFVEFKVVDNMALHWSKCRLAQDLTLKQMRKKYDDVFYVVYSKRNDAFYRVNPEDVEEDKGVDVFGKGLEIKG